MMTKVQSMIPNWLKLMWNAVLMWWTSGPEQEEKGYWEEARLAESAAMVVKLDALEAEIAERYGKALSQAESACLLNMLYHVKLERIFRGL